MHPSVVSGKEQCNVSSGCEEAPLTRAVTHRNRHEPEVRGWRRWWSRAARRGRGQAQPGRTARASKCNDGPRGHVLKKSHKEKLSNAKLKKIFLRARGRRSTTLLFPVHVRARRPAAVNKRAVSASGYQDRVRDAVIYRATGCS